jgi:hypothetical protein
VSKLACYQALGIPEVWFWEDGSLLLYGLRGDCYERLDHSNLPGLNTLNLDLLKRCILIAETDTGEAIRVFRSQI